MVAKTRRRHAGRRRRKKILTTCLFLAFLVAAVASCGVVYAYLLDNDAIVNTVVIGGVNTSVSETFTNPVVLKPGTSVTKQIRVKNDGPNDAYVRVKAVFSDSDMENLCTVEINTADWAYDASDGYYYYKKILKDGETTSLLYKDFDTGGNIKINSNAAAGDIDSFDIIVYSEAVQSYDASSGGDFASYRDAWNRMEENRP